MDIKEYDALVVVTPADYKRLECNYERLCRYLPVRRIIFIGSGKVGEYVKNSGLGDKVGFKDENEILQFDKVHEYLNGRLKKRLNGDELPRGVTGWYYQQFLKMQYAKFCRDEYYMVWDGDTVPCGDFSMFNAELDKPYLDTKSEFHKEYFDTLEKIIPGMTKAIERSFIAEHMLINTGIMNELIGVIESNGNLPGTEYWEKIFDAIPEDILDKNSFSEFETYGTFVARRHTLAYRLREWHSFRYGGDFFHPDQMTDEDYSWLAKDFFAISFEKKSFVRADHENLFNNPEYQTKLSARKMLEIVQEELGGYKEIWT